MIAATFLLFNFQSQLDFGAFRGGLTLVAAIILRRWFGQISIRLS